MKKYLLSILFSLFTLVGFNQATTYYTNSIIVHTNGYNKWYQCEESGRGKGSFFLIVTNDSKKYNSDKNSPNGYYYYDIFFFNNSFYKNGATSSSYIKNIYYYAWVNNRWNQVYYQDYVLVKPPTKSYDGNFHAAWLRYPYKIQKIKIVWYSVSIY